MGGQLERMNSSHCGVQHERRGCTNCVAMLGTCALSAQWIGRPTIFLESHTSEKIMYVVYVRRCTYACAKVHCPSASLSSACVAMRTKTVSTT
jgi:hypothetical protein